MIPVLERVRVPRSAGGRPRARPDRLSSDKSYSSRRNRRLLQRRQIKHTSPIVATSRLIGKSVAAEAVGPPAATGAGMPAGTRSNERSHPQRLRAATARFDKRAYAFPGTVTVTAIQPRLRP